MIRIHIVGEDTEKFQKRVSEIAARIENKSSGEDIITITKRPGVNMQMIAALESAWVKLVVCGIDPIQPVSATSAVNYIDMSQTQKGGRQQTFDDIDQLDEYLIRKSERVFVIGSKTYCERIELKVKEINAALPGISHKKVICSILGEAK